MKRARETYKLAIVGWRKFNDKVLFNKVLEDYTKEHGFPSLVVSGGAKGADTFAERWAISHGIPTKILEPDWDTHGKRAAIKRNTDIVKACTHMIAFPSKNKKGGTQDSIRKAKKLGINVLEIKID